MTNKSRSSLYIGVTSNLYQRIREHKAGKYPNSFTQRYNIKYCIYFEEFPSITMAIEREKQLKKWNRQKKEHLISSQNPTWKELVTEKGFIRETIPFAQQVQDLLKEIVKENKEDSQDSSFHSE